MLRQISCRIESWPLSSPFRISRGVKTAADVVYVEITEGSFSGHGECVPYLRYGESCESVAEQIDAVSDAICDGASRDELLSLMPAGAARNAVDCALWDLEAKIARQSVSSLIDVGTLNPVTTAVTIGLDTPEKMAAAAEPLKGAPLIKVKVDANDPAACLRAVRAVIPDAQMIVDPNESWNADLLENLQPLLSDLKTTFVEQPVPAAEDESLKQFVPLVPNCADESCHTSEGLEALKDCYQIVNIKLDKTGGLTEALRLLARARELDFGVMIGCMVSTSLSIAPALHIAQKADFADLDGPLWIANDRQGGVILSDAKLSLPKESLWGNTIYI
ncbi:N-acetyl-D-Glu racemase DgcA [Hyphococcus sp. DH-69]|uniref:N-acetyl-D-Glu racemase DgcA n=1 Tax=Hyphococcus formosus TaxID=3143534 RepID=UPI00398A9A01